MDFRVGEDQRELADGIRAMVAGRLPLDHLRAREGDARAISVEDWTALGETGVFALTLPEPAGTGLSMAEAVVVFEELGRALVPGPLVGTFLAARAGVVEGAAEGRPRSARTAPGAGPVAGRAPGRPWTRCLSSRPTAVDRRHCSLRSPSQARRGWMRHSTR